MCASELASNARPPSLLQPLAPFMRSRSDSSAAMLSSRPTSFFLFACVLCCFPGNITQSIEEMLGRLCRAGPFSFKQFSRNRNAVHILKRRGAVYRYEARESN